MIFNRELLLVILFQIDKYLEMFSANSIVEALMIGAWGEGKTRVGTNGCGN